MPAVLITARERSVPWHEVARALNILENNGAVDDQGRPWLAVAAVQSGYSAHQLRVMTRTLKKVEDLARNTRMPIQTPLSWPLSSLEILGRIAKVDESLAASLLKRGISNFVDLRKAYHRVRDRIDSPSAARSAGHRNGRAFRLEVIKTANNPTILPIIVGPTDTGEIIGPHAWPGGMQFANPDAVVITQSAHRACIIALECARIFGDIHQDQAEKVIMKAAVEATFFDKYFLCLPSWSEFAPLANMRRALELNNVGILTFCEGKVSSILSPDGLPVPDRRSMIIGRATMRRKLGLRG